MKKNDLILAATLLLIGFAAFFVRSIGRITGSRIEITVDGQLMGSYFLDENQEIPIGSGNRLLIQDGKASMSFADCPDGDCIRQGAVSKSGETIVCLPNRVVVQVKGEEAADLDGVVG